MPEEFRRIFLILSFLKAFQIARNEHDNIDRLLHSLHVADLGIIIGPGLEETTLLTEFAQLLHEFLGEFFERSK